MTERFATLTFERRVAAPVATLWQAWTAPAARAIWAPPAPDVTVQFLEADTREGGRELSICKAAGHPDVRVEVGWLHLQPNARSVNYELVSSDGQTDCAALVTADIREDGDGSRIVLTVQVSSLATNMVAGYEQGYGAGLQNLAEVAARTMVLTRVIRAPRAVVWGAWVNPQTLPAWWGPDGFRCRTDRIDLRTGGEWLFDMIGPDGTVYPNHHKYVEVQPERRISYTLLAGENGARHADAWATFDDTDGSTTVTLGMVFSTMAEFQTARGFGAAELGLQTLGKLARFVGAD
ncbi:Uncharacterized conserved protein YndB, AHSA1/START domain [Gemmobacter megaterium]|uniref:Uncharacterized conserved protein YndB, AHSA1/START domain n=1 Tax=Gemmobacter megaterium TaxID=1086013 RepID=A0A1N7N7Y9_9RHOB|nr:SRPBCC domain-containing protein [Gemmobacter megaterium]GGE13454.1 ATPase [Gemmobacter megaterium]SIS94301.1 Uncharacterized conserved protein YndB, AHSA1/START domain [Gemmobacter megaterium]